MKWRSLEETRDLLTRVFAELVERGSIEPVATDEGSRELWLRCDLASIVENRLLEKCDPRTMNPDSRLGACPSFTPRPCCLFWP